MVFLAITPAGLVEALQLAAPTNAPVWCGCDAAPEAELKAIKGRNLSWFNYPLIGPENLESLGDAFSTIAEHHPNDRLWVEHEKMP